MTGIKVLVGEIEEGVIVLEFEFEEYLSLCGEVYEKPAFSEEEGEDKARDYLEDGELWKMAVEAEQTTSGLDDWIEQVLNIDGWQETLGDIFETKDGKYALMNSCGQIDISVQPNDFVKTFIPKEDVEFIFECWKKYHSKKKVPKKIIKQLTDIFTKHESDISDWNSEESEE